MGKKPNGPRPPQAAASAGPEAELIIRCSRPRLDRSNAERIAALVRQGVDWESAIRAALPQGVLPFLYRSLRAACPEAVPGPVLEHLREQSSATAKLNLIYAGRLLKLLDLLRADDVRAIPFKGPTLAVAAYGDLTLRPFGDLDLLIPPSDIPKARQLLASAGYQLEKHEPGWEYHFIGDRGLITVDLHQRIVPKYLPSLWGFDELWGRLKPVSLLGSAVRTLRPEDLLLVLSLQLAKDLREWKQRILQICDTAELVRSHPGAAWAEVLTTARAAGAERLLLLNLRMAETVMEVQLPAEFRVAIAADPVVARLTEEARARLLPELAGLPEAARFRAEVLYEDSAFYLRSRERARDKLVYLLLLAGSRLRLLVSPTERDRAFLSLPRGLSSLYFLVRPVRVLRQWAEVRGRAARRKARLAGELKGRGGDGGSTESR